MDGSTFYDSVAAHQDLEITGVLDGQILVKHSPTKAVYGVAPESVASQDWETLEAILCGRRNPTVLSHMTRIVGYYSQIENWNKSKLGELASRRAGHYAVAETVGAGVAAAAG